MPRWLELITMTILKHCALSLDENTFRSDRHNIIYKI